MDVASAYALVAAALEARRPAHGYLIVGDVRGEALALAERILTKVFGDAHVRDRTHPDIHWLVPELKSRVISVDAMREKIVAPMAQTSFTGGWKAGVIVSADRLKTESANAFLKTLEEPPPETFFLLLTDVPEQLLPTIVSRCQRIDVSRPGGRMIAEPWLSRILTVVSAPDIRGVVEKAAVAMRLCGILEELRAKAEELVNAEQVSTGDGPEAETTKEECLALVSSRYREFRLGFAQALESWFRDLAALRLAGEKATLRHAPYRALLAERAARLTRAEAFRNVEAVENLARSFDRNLKEDMVLFAFADAVRFGTERT